MIRRAFFYDKLARYEQKYCQFVSFEYVAFNLLLKCIEGLYIKTVLITGLWNTKIITTYWV